MRASLWKVIAAAASIGVLTAAVTSCAAVRAAGDHVAEGGGAVGGGLLFYLMAIASGAVGWVAAGIAGVGGWIGAWWFTPKAAPGVQVASSPLGTFVFLGLLALLVLSPRARGLAWLAITKAAGALMRLLGHK